MLERRSMTIEADPEHLAGARDWALDIARDAGLVETDCFQVKVAISEAVANAIQHGSDDPADRIRIEAFAEDGQLVFEVRDSGTFVMPLARASIEDESGRGLEMLTLLMDEVHITSTDDGSLLRFSKHL